MMKYVLGFPVAALARGGVCMAVLLLLAACASDGNSPGNPAHATALGNPSPAAAGGATLESPDALRVGEMILIEYSGVGDPPPSHQERIKTDGLIALPSIGSIQAAGITRGDLEQEIHKRYVPNYYRQLTVVVRNEGRFFYVSGQVRTPSQYQYVKEMTALKAVATAGGFTDFARKSKVVVTRADGRKLQVNCDKALRDPKLDIAIFPDDSIYVPRRYF